MNKMLAATSKGNIDTPNISNQLNLKSDKNYLWYIGGKELNSTYSYVVCAKTKEEALKIDPYPGFDLEIPEIINCIGIANSKIKCGQVICASLNHLKLN
jgi:hypothetical protein